MHNGDIERDDRAVARPREMAIVGCQEKFEIDDRKFYTTLPHIALIAIQRNHRLITATRIKLSNSGISFCFFDYATS